MKNFMSAIAVIAMGAFLASCDLQPKISSIPDSIGDFISARYPAMLADPDTEPEIYNSAISDYGIYASPELYGSVDMDDYVNYANISDYTMPTESESKTKMVIEPVKEQPESDTKPESETEPEPESETESEMVDILEIPEYKNEELHVPPRAALETVVVRRGDTLYSIANENGTTVDAMAAENNLTAPYTLRIGQVLKLPVAKPIEKTAPVIEPKPEPKPEVKVKPKNESVVAKPAPVKSENVRVPLKTVTVARGDTLYSLSRMYAVPVNDLAVMNDLRAPFALNAGQTLRVPDLPAVAPVSKKVAKTEPKKTEASKTVSKKTESVKPEKVEPQKTKIEKAEPKKVENKSGAVKTAKPVEKKDKVVEKTKQVVSKPKQPETPKIAARSSSKFTWPVRGTILSHYGAKTGGLYNDGINISAAAGTSVMAAENGVVAYAGNEVRGMGNLVIIQHADGFMTVYAHMGSMSVRRGARVSVGQKIGTVGQTGKVTKPQLHFEVRKGTKSYNPTNYLKK